MREQRHGHPLDRLAAVLSLDELVELRRASEDVYLDDLLEEWIVAPRPDDSRARRRSRSALRCAARSPWRRPRVPGRSSRAATTSSRTTSSTCSSRCSATGWSCGPTFLAETRDVSNAEALAAVARPLASSSRRRRGRTGRRPSRAPCEGTSGARSGRAAFPLVPRYRLSRASLSAPLEARDAAAEATSPDSAPTSRATRSRRSTGTRARGSRPRGRDDEFVVRERFADEAPRVVVVLDRRPSMGLYPDWSPWLVEARRRLASRPRRSSRARCPRAAPRDTSTPPRPGGPSGSPPRGRSPLELIEERARSARLRRGPGLAGRAGSSTSRAPTASLGSGSFVFVLSDFLEPPPASILAARGRTALGDRPGRDPGSDLGAELPVGRAR